MFSFVGLNWWAILVCVVIGQVVLTVWFAAVFARPWAAAYGVEDPKQHTSEVPGYTYAIGLACMVLLTLGLAMMQKMAGVSGVVGGLTVGLFAAIMIVVPTALPGYAFLRRYGAFKLAIGAQVLVILLNSVILALWT